MSLVERFPIQHIVNAGGSIGVAQGERDVPFAIKRVYYLHNIPAGQTRGHHAHKTLTQVAVCVSGSCSFRLDDGSQTEDVALDNPHLGIIIRPMLWRTIYEFTNDCVLLVLASDHYDESDYIRDYEEFKRVAAAR